MHRFRSPLVALIALLLIVGPLAGRIAQIDPKDPLQISTPTAYERSTGQTLEHAELHRSFPFDLSEDVSFSNPILMGDQYLLLAHKRVMSLNGKSLAPQWEITLDNRAITYSTVFMAPELADPSHVLIHTESEGYLIDLLDGEITWVNSTITSAGQINQLANGNLTYHVSADNGQSLALIDGLSGNTLLVREDVTAYQNADDRFYLLTESALKSINPHSGELLWSLPITGISGLQIQGQSVYLTSDDEIVAVDAESGKEKWLSFIEHGSTLHAGAERHLLLSTSEGIMKLDSATGLYTDLLPNAEFVLLRSNILVAMIGSNFTGTNIDTNEVAWQVDLVGRIERWGQFGDILVYITPSDSFLLIDNDTGMLLYSERANNYSTFSNQGLIVLAFDQQLIAFEVESKQVAWTLESTEPIRLTYRTAELLVYETESAITSVDPTTGDEFYSLTRSTEPVEFRVIDGFVFHSVDNGIIATELSSGYSAPFGPASDLHILRVTSFEDIVYIKSPNQLFVFDPVMGEMYAPPYDANLYSTDANGNAIIHAANELSFVESNGQLRWEDSRSPAPVSMTIWPNQGVISLQLSNEVRILDAQNGEVLWRAPIPSPTEFWGYTHVATTHGLIYFTYEGAEWWTLPSAHASTLAGETTLFASPSQDAVVRGTFPTGSIAIPTGNERQRADGLWLEVLVDGVTGWVPKDALTEDHPIERATPVG